jgi:hypothetical protein
MVEEEEVGVEGLRLMVLRAVLRAVEVEVLRRDFQVGFEGVVEVERLRVRLFRMRFSLLARLGLVLWT